MAMIGPNFSADHDSRQPMFLITTGILILLSTVVVALRLYCRFYRVRNVGLDDYFMVAALFVTIGMAIMNGYHISWGTGQHLKYLDVPSMRIPTLKHFYFYQLVYPLALFLVKASILALYHRIFELVEFRYKVWSVAAFVTVYTIVVLFVNAFECRPNPSQAWSPTFPKGCNNLRATYFALGAINVLTDITIFLLPLKAFCSLQLDPRRRWALLGVFMIGGLAVIASIVRIYALWLYNVTEDISYDSIFILLLSQIEVNVAIISASAPAIRPLLRNTPLSFSQPEAYGSGYLRTIGSESASNNQNSRSRTRSNGQIELLTYGGRGTPVKHKALCGGRGNTSEESILIDGGITKTMETRIDFEQINDEELPPRRLPTKDPK
ncbi:hypothetical protein GT037_007985 [Alternaria burnsii]|uniref:Rhodopsin domain-containing protein n=2 Tax=Alternaria sect. Alternaria TaxID=2499237 RepID=A0A8H7B0Q6_9PLEO|nr:uncharacterized protein GT037_007985 [Alternaria burnsii]KAF7674219.1 hypothetical protein GT037_007985 [Alternaria burnsii]